MIRGVEGGREGCIELLMSFKRLNGAKLLFTLFDSSEPKGLVLFPVLTTMVIGGVRVVRLVVLLDASIATRSSNGIRSLNLQLVAICCACLFYVGKRRLSSAGCLFFLLSQMHESWRI